MNGQSGHKLNLRNIHTWTQQCPYMQTILLQRVEVNKLIALIPPSVLLFYDAKALSEWETGEVSFLLIN